MLGIVAADWQIAGHKFRKYAPILGLVALDIALVLEPYSSQPSRWGLADEAGFFVQTNVGWQLVAFFVVVAAGQVAGLRRVLELRPLCAIGVAAYSIYLTHQPIIDVWSEHTGLHLAPVWSFSGAVGLSLAVGFAFWFFGERPFVERPLRSRLVSALELPVGRVLAFAGLPPRFSLVTRIVHVPGESREPAREAALEPVAEPSVSAA
jgi:peptidoglycan/LPS O-acetylase OafA/YrhL